ncbi:MAG: tail fiber domain-containing protein [Patescibacteria group bacterium]
MSSSDEGGQLSQSVSHFNFVGAGVTATHVGATTTITIPGGGGNGISYDWLQQANTFGVLSLTPTSTLPIWIKSTATSTFVGGIESWSKISAPYFNATSTTASSTFANGINLTGGCFAVNGTCLGGSSGSSFAYPFTPTSNYAVTNQATTGIAWFQNGLNASSTSHFSYASTTMISAANASTTNLYISSLASGYVPYATTGGLLSNSPLSVTGSAVYTAVSDNVGFGVLAGASYGIGYDSTNVGTGIYGGNLLIASFRHFGDASWFNPDNRDFDFRVDGDNQDYLFYADATTDKIGIGTSSPYAKLSVVGPVVAEYFSATSTTATSTLAGGLAVGSNALNVLQNGKVGIGLSNPAAGLEALGGIYASNNSNHDFVIDLNPYALSIGIGQGSNLGRYAKLSGDSNGAGVSSEGFIALNPGNAEALRAISGGNIGIGTTSPYAKLSVVGEVVASNYTATTTATSTFGGSIAVTEVATSSFAGGINLSAGCFSINNTCVGGGGSSQWTTAGSDIYYSTGKVGIGTSSPYAALSVVGEAVARNFTATSTTATSTFVGGLLAGGTTGLNVLQNGNVGIGTAAPTAKLTVDGTAEFTDGNAYLLIRDYSGLGRVEFYSNDHFYFTGTNNVCLSDSFTCIERNGNKINIKGQDGIMFSNHSGGEWGRFENTGNFGIGTTSPYAKLSVAGTVVGQNFVATSTTATSTFAGGLAVGSNAFTVTTSGNVGIGTASPESVFQVLGATNLAAWGTNTVKGLVTIGSPGTTGGSLMIRTDSLNGSFPSGIGFDGSYSDPISTVNIKAYGVASAGTYGSDIAFWTQYLGTAPTEKMRLSASGNLGIGTSSPYAKLSVAGHIAGEYFSGTSTSATSTFAGGLNVGNGGIVYDWASGITSIASLQTGNFTFDTNAGQVTWTDLLVDSNAPSGTNQSYTANLNGIPMLSIGGISNGAGWLNRAGVGIGTTTNTALFAIQNDALFASSTLYSFQIASTTVAGLNTTAFAVTNAGKVGIGTSSPWATLSATGTVAFAGISNSGAGNYVCHTGAYEITYSATACAGVSSERFKHDIASLSVSALDQVNALRAVSFIYNADMSPNDQTTHLGFIAEEVALVNPDLAVYEPDGKVRSVKYDEFAPVLVKAMQELDVKVEGLMLASGLSGTASSSPSFFSSLKNWFADKGNMIEKFFAKEIHTEKICVAKSDGTEICLTGDELQAAVGEHDTEEENTEDEEVATTTPPVEEEDEPTDDTATTTPPVEEEEEVIEPEVIEEPETPEVVEEPASEPEVTEEPEPEPSPEPTPEP